MQEARDNKILNYFKLIKLFNWNRELAIKFYTSLNDATKKNILNFNSFQFTIFKEEIKEYIRYNDIWSNNLISILEFIYNHNIKIKWKNDAEVLAIKIIKDKLKISSNDKFISKITDYFFNLNDEINFDKIFNNSGNIVHYDDKNYPKYFKKNIDYPPICFFYEGNLDLLNINNTISIVGTRNPSEEGIYDTKKIADTLIKLKYTIVSGLAKGVDFLAHDMCKKNNYKNAIAVIGTPLFKYYPKENRFLQMWIKENGLLLSEYASFENTLKFNFLRRNNFMSIISAVSIVVEASDTSGTISQARNTLKNQRYLLTPKKTFENKNNSWPSKFRKDYDNLVQIFDSKTDFLSTLNKIFHNSDNRK